MKASAVLPVLTEDQEQEALFRWAAVTAFKYPDLKMLYACPNGGLRNITTAVRLKATGVKAGVPDVCLPVPSGKYHGLYIEMKRVKGGQLSQFQRSWLQALSKQGYLAVVAHGANEAIKVITEYLTEKEKENTKNIYNAVR